MPLLIPAGWDVKYVWANFIQRALNPADPGFILQVGKIDHITTNVDVYIDGHNATVPPFTFFSSICEVKIFACWYDQQILKNTVAGVIYGNDPGGGNPPVIVSFNGEAAQFWRVAIVDTAPGGEGTSGTPIGPVRVAAIAHGRETG